MGGSSLDEKNLRWGGFGFTPTLTKPISLTSLQASLNSCIGFNLLTLLNVSIVCSIFPSFTIHLSQNCLSAPLSFICIIFNWLTFCYSGSWLIQFLCKASLFIGMCRSRSISNVSLHFNHQGLILRLTSSLISPSSPIIEQRYILGGTSL